MNCDKCNTQLPDNAAFCPNCGAKVTTGKGKNIYIALILTFLLTGLGSIYANNVKNGLILLALRLFFAGLGVLLNVFFAFSFLIWAFGFYVAYRDVQIANGRENPRILKDFERWDTNKKIISLIIVVVIVAITVTACFSIMSTPTYESSSSNTHYYVSDSQGSGGSSYSSSHYSGVDDSPQTIAKNDPDWYYDHYEYGDNPEIDDYLESEGYE